MTPDDEHEERGPAIRKAREAGLEAARCAAPGRAPCRRTGRTVATATGRGELDTCDGTLVPVITKRREGTYFPEWLLQRCKWVQRALTSVVATCYLLGGSTRRMDRLVRSLGITTLSRSQGSEMAKDLDAQVEQFRTRRLGDTGRAPSSPRTRWC